MRVAALGALVELMLASAAHAAQKDARQVLSAARHAMGMMSGTQNLEAVGRIEAEGLSGNHDEIIRPSDGAFATRDRFPSFAEAEGYDGRTHWREDRSGGTHLLNAPYTVGTTMSEAWLRHRGYLQPGTARIVAVAHEKIGDSTATVLTMRPRGGNPVRLAFDDASHLLVRAQWDKPISAVTETYRDYRSVGAFKAPFHVDIEESGERAEISIDRYLRSKASGSAFERPRPPSDTIIQRAVHAGDGRPVIRRRAGAHQRP